jgi:hypothetical protein
MHVTLLYTARPEPFNSPLILSLSKDEPRVEGSP